MIYLGRVLKVWILSSFRLLFPLFFLPGDNRLAATLMSDRIQGSDFKESSPSLRCDTPAYTEEGRSSWNKWICEVAVFIQTVATKNYSQRLYLGFSGISKICGHLKFFYYCHLFFLKKVLQSQCRAKRKASRIRYHYISERKMYFLSCSSITSNTAVPISFTVVSNPSSFFFAAPIDFFVISFGPLLPLSCFISSLLSGVFLCPLFFSSKR